MASDQDNFSFHILKLRAFSAGSLLLELFTLATWRLVFWLIAFAALSLFEIPTSMGASGSLILWLLFVSGIVYLILTDLRKFRIPSSHDIDRRIEVENEIPHRPLTSQQDVASDTAASKLWEREQNRKARLLRGLNPVIPKPLISERDPKALRLMLLLCLLCGIGISGADWSRKILDGFSAPRPLFQGAPEKRDKLSVWITPPEYTGLERFILSDPNDENIKIPQDSTIKALVFENWLSGIRPPDIKIDNQTYPMQKSEGGSYILEMPIPDGQHLSIRNGLFKTTSWAYDFVTDQEPALTLDPAFKTLSDSKIQFSMKTSDDYGVKYLHLKMGLDPLADNITTGEPYQETRAIMSPASTDFQIAPVYNLTAHPWAGLPVILTFSVEDHLGQTIAAEPLKITLPERVFRYPLARKLIHIRKEIARTPHQNHRGEAVIIAGLLQLPNDFGHDKGVFLALRSAASRLLHSEPSLERAQDVMRILWNVALHLEDGDLGLNARDLQTAKANLEEALQNPDTSDTEIAHLMEQLREAMAEYMQALGRELQKRMSEKSQSPMISPEFLSNIMDMEDIAGLMDKMESEMLSGDRNSAQEMLSKLQRLMDMTNPSMDTALPEDIQEMMESMQGLQELVERQKSLRSETIKQADLFKKIENLGIRGHREKTPFIDTTKNKTEQRALYDSLDRLIQDAQAKLKEIPDNLGLAKQTMQGTIERLESNRPDHAVNFQDKTIEHLTDAQEQMSKMLAERMQQMVGISFGGMPRRDPFGRPYGETNPDNGKVKIPTQAQKKREQEILNEIRQRAGQRDRPRDELEYYRRLLKRF